MKSPVSLTLLALLATQAASGAEPALCDSLMQQTGTVSSPSVDASFYADGSCSISADRTSNGQVTIARTTDKRIADTLHLNKLSCITPTAATLSVLLPGNAIDGSRRFSIIKQPEVGSPRSNIDGQVVAWLECNNGKNIAIDSGSFLLRQAPIAHIAGAALQSDQRVVASLKGLVLPPTR